MSGLKRVGDTVGQFKNGHYITIEGKRYPLFDRRRGFNSVVFPVVRKVYPSLLASSIVSVQPMTLPVGKIFMADYEYQSTKKEDDE